MLTNVRHEAFAHGIASGQTIDAAYVNAGYSRNSGNASRLNGDERVIARVGQLKVLAENIRIRSLQEIILTKEWVIEQLIGVVILAKAKADFAGVNKALHLLGLELGMYVQRKEVGKLGAFDGYTIADRREHLLGIARQFGLGHISDDGRRRFGDYLGSPIAVPK
jgi:hypothetical protein